MTGVAHVHSEKPKPWLRPTSPSTAVKKMLQISRIEPQTESVRLPEEAQELKNLLLAADSRQGSRFSFSRLRRVVVPPVQIPVELATTNAISNIVGGSKIPMTKAMWKRHRARLLRRLPGRIDERVAW